MYFEVDGMRVFAATGGKPFEPEWPAVVFLHGSALDHTFWGLYTRFFAFRGYAVLAPDLPGHSLSAGPQLARIEDMADWLERVAQTLDTGKLSLVAHSQGCLVALEYAARYPQRLRSVSFIASGLATPVNPGLIEAAENDPEAAVGMMIAWGFGPAGHFHQGPVPGSSMMAGGRKVMGVNVPEALATDLRACDAYRNGEAAAAGVQAPAQVIIGGRDRMAPARATAELVAALSAPRVDVIPRSGHMVPLEAPNACRQLLRDFIFTHNPAGQA
ncbi:MAG: alpha/beta fold hydrolase [Xanthomonadales bacterium]|nr:alpha/beta fold hydrolase [Xanthomonadales bacterium]NIN60204.1 alpha/beta fold hydrolase [Xanthomonadales bacterium]NIN75570.1 alpha/beta fold hydrolase [Xanthomonadales bacterium]NIO13016.1 alpha/beta fold hydrolase [Xanthomonadales bacterium]NIP12597.1 alpha/beta fold hydrolase [Xanthomonadales bacterium]